MEPAVFTEDTITTARITGSMNMRKGIQQMALPKPWQIEHSETFCNGHKYRQHYYLLL